MDVLYHIALQEAITPAEDSLRVAEWLGIILLLLQIIMILGGAWVTLYIRTASKALERLEGDTARLEQAYTALNQDLTRLRVEREADSEWIRTMRQDIATLFSRTNRLLNDTVSTLAKIVDRLTTGESSP